MAKLFLFIYLYTRRSQFCDKFYTCGEGYIFWFHVHFRLSYSKLFKEKRDFYTSQKIQIFRDPCCFRGREQILVLVIWNNLASIFQYLSPV